jgi:hypothetical protein
MNRWFHEIALGARLAVAGGRDGWARLAMTAAGVGLGVMLLLTAAAVPDMLVGRHERTAARDDVPAGPLAAGANTLLVARATTEFRGHRVFGRIVRAEGPRAPVPPGLTRLPGPGELAVSPALARLLASPEGALLRPRLDYPVVATIADGGLAGPNEYAFYLGSDRIRMGQDGVWRIDRFGVAVDQPGLHPILLLLIVIAFVVLLLPVAVFIAAAVRFAGDRRDRRLAALRLVGADRRTVRRIAAGEALVGTVLGLAAGVLLLLAGRPLVERFTVVDTSVFAEDVRPSPALTVLVLLAVPVCAIGVSLLALRRTVIEPLGVFRNAAGVRRRLWWRLVLPAVGVLALYPLVDQVRSGGDRSDGYRVTAATYQVATGATLLLIGVAALLPWLVDAVVHRIGGGSVPWQLAVRRLQLTSATSARVVNGVAVAVAGTIALQTLFASVDQEFQQATGQDPRRAQVYVTVQNGQSVDAFQRTPGVRTALSIADVTLPDTGRRLEVGDCAALREVATVDRCAAGDVFLVSNGDIQLPPPGRWVLPEWRIPLSARTVEARQDPSGQLFVGIFATPEAVPASVLRGSRVGVYLTLDPAQPDAYEHVRNTAARIDPMATVLALAATSETGQFTAVRRGLFIGVLATLLLIGASMLLSTLEQLRERRRLLAVLVAFGTRRTTLTWSVLYQVAVPVALGMLLAAVAGAVLGAILLAMVNRPVALDWVSIGGIVAAGAAVVAGVTALSLPVLWRLIRPGGLRTE